MSDLFSPSAKMRQAVQTAGESVRSAARDTGKLVIAALVVATGALLVALASLLAVVKLRKALA